MHRQMGCRTTGWLERDSRFLLLALPDKPDQRGSVGKNAQPPVEIDSVPHLLPSNRDDHITLSETCLLCRRTRAYVSNISPRSG